MPRLKKPGSRYSHSKRKAIWPPRPTLLLRDYIVSKARQKMQSVRCENLTSCKMSLLRRSVLRSSEKPDSPFHTRKKGREARFIDKSGLSRLFARTQRAI